MGPAHFDGLDEMRRGARAAGKRDEEPRETSEDGNSHTEKYENADVHTFPDGRLDGAKANGTGHINNQNG